LGREWESHIESPKNSPTAEAAGRTGQIGEGAEHARRNGGKKPERDRKGPAHLSGSLTHRAAIVVTERKRVDCKGGSR